MQLNIIDGKNLQHCLQQVLENLKNFMQKKVLIFVPDKFSLEMEIALFEKLNIECTFDIEVTTISRFCKSILSDYQSADNLSAIGATLLIENILNANRRNFKCFKNDNFSYKYSAEIFKTIAQLKSSGQVWQTLTDFKHSNISLQNKINDLGVVLKNYEQQKGTRVDDNDIITQALLLIGSQNLQEHICCFVGFDDFTFQGYLLIEQMLLNCREVNVCNYHNTAGNRHIYVNQVKPKLVAMCKKLAVNYNIKNAEYISSPLKCFLSDNLFAFNKKSFELKQNNIKLINTQSFAKQATYIARHIRQKILNGDSFKDFGLLVFNLQNHTEELKKEFDKYDINYYFDIKHSLYFNTYTKFIILVLNILNNNFQKQILLNFVNSPFIKLPQKSKHTIIENIIQYNINSQKQLNSLAKQGSDLHEFNIIIEQITCHNTNDVNLKNNLNGFENYLEYINTIFDTENTLQNLALKTDDLYEQKILQQCFDKTNQLIFEILKINSEISIDTFLDLFVNAAKEISIAPLPLSLDCVQVLDAADGYKSFKHLFLVDADKYNAPAFANDCGIILDGEILQMQNIIDLSPAIGHINKLKKFNIYNTLFNFKDNLTITMSAKNLNEISELTKELKDRLYFVKKQSGQLILQNLQIENYDCQTDCLPLNLYELTKDVSGTPADKLDENVKDLSVMTIKNNRISPSQLESYLKCPFKHFVDYGLKPLKRQNYQLRALDIGNLLHSLAQDFYQCSQSEKERLNLHNFCENTIKKYLKIWHNNYQNRQIIKNLINEGVRFLQFLIYMDNNSNFKIKYCEYAFANDNLKLGAVNLIGKIDRVDFSDEGFRIIDYKTGNAQATLKELYYGKKLQLFLYAWALEQTSGLKCMGSFYMPIKNEFVKLHEKSNLSPYRLDGFYKQYGNNIKNLDIKLDGQDCTVSDIVKLRLTKSRDGIFVPYSKDKFLSETEFEKFLNYSKELALQAIKEIEGGVIKSSAWEESSSGECDYCEYLQICKKNSRNCTMRQLDESIAKDIIFTGGGK